MNVGVCVPLLSSFHPSVLEDDIPVQPVGQVQGAVQPSQQHLQQPVPAGHLLPPEEMPLALHPQSRWLPFVWRLTSTTVKIINVIHCLGHRVWRAR